MSITDFLSGRKLLAEVESPINGTLTVVRELAWGTYIMAGGLPQSGGLARRIWEKSLRVVKKVKQDDPPKSILVLGFAGGGIAHIARSYWPECDIYGVDIDPLMVDLGKKYLHWGETEAKVWVEDAVSFIDEISKGKEPKGILVSDVRDSIIPKHFDLVCVDMYVGDGIPEKFNKKSFVIKVNKIVAPGGMVVFNRLYGTQNIKIAEDFHEVLDSVYSKIRVVYPEANVMFLCEK